MVRGNGAPIYDTDGHRCSEFSAAELYYLMYSSKHYQEEKFLAEMLKILSNLITAFKKLPDDKHSVHEIPSLDNKENCERKRINHQ